MKKLITAILIFSTLATLVFGIAVSAANFGSGAEAVANDVKIIKTGLYGRKISFSDADIKQGLCITDFEKITVTKLPATSDGTLMLAGRRVSEGVSIKRKNLPSLVFIPADKNVESASFKFTVDEYASGSEIEFLLRFTDKINYEPKIDKGTADALSVSTQREINFHGKLSATDQEGDKIEYIIVSYPKNGVLQSFNRSTGEYVYAPQDSYTGSDSFVCVARDEWGNFSEAETVNISVTKRLSEVKYVDMTDRAEYNAAVAMTAIGVMGGKVIGDGVYFSPDETVTRAEFVSMAMKALGIKADSTITKTFFDDNDSIPTPLIGYIATAQKTGIIGGSFENGQLLFKPNDSITKYDAAVIMSNLIGAKSEGDLPVFSDEKEIPTWARGSVYAMCSFGVFEYSGANIEASAHVTRADSARYLYKILSIKNR